MNEKLEAFYQSAEQCDATICMTSYPDNASCRKAHRMAGGDLQITSKEQYVTFLQIKILLNNTYARWLEGEAGKSVRGRYFCGKNLEYLGHKMHAKFDDR